jgi:xanthine dehydrogenase accessory factor
MIAWQFIQDKFAAGIAVMLLYVLESNGSSPGRQGFCMGVSMDGEMCGSIGGGIMEHKFVEMAKARLADGEKTDTLYKQVHDKAAGKNQSGMICSGEQTIFLHEINEQDAEHIGQLLLSEKACKNAAIHLSEKGIVFSDHIPEDDFLFVQYSENSFQLIEKTGYKNRLHIIGGGHCALAFSKLMSSMDFFITVYEERSGLNTMEQNVYAHKKILVETYAELSSLADPGKNVYVVIMTFGYRTDDIALRALFPGSYKYIGLLGSRKKTEKLFAEYEKSELHKDWLSKIHSPVGLSIKSQTPDEIAVSIAAEIIGVKNRFREVDR